MRSQGDSGAEIGVSRLEHIGGMLVDWLFDGLGTLFIGLLLGGGAGGVAGYRRGCKKIRQEQWAGTNSVQTQAGRDVKKSKK